MSEPRLLAVLGYSARESAGLHPVCAARLEHATRIAESTDAILLSGWSRRRGKTAAEADLMARAWPGPHRLLVDRSATSTYGNVVGAAAAARELGAHELVLVTSCWHARRAGTLARFALRGSGIRVVPAPAPDPGTRRARLRELACWPLVPAQAALAGRRR